MAEETSVTPEPTAVTPAVEPAPVVAPVVEVKTVEPTPVVEAKKEETPVAPKESDTVLGEALTKPVEVKPVETPKVEETKPAETNKTEGQSDEPAPPPTYEPFTLPEGVTLAEDRVKEFTSILGEFEGKTKAEHAAIQEFGQKAVDFHVAEIQRVAESINNEYQKSWEDTKKSWKEQFMSDPELGGNRFQTTLDSAINFIRTHGGTEAQQNEFRDLMNTTGLGNHPAMIRILANAGIKMQEGRPLVATTPVSPAKSKVATMYGRNN